MHISTKINIFWANFVYLFFKQSKNSCYFKTLSASTLRRVLRPPGIEEMVVSFLMRNLLIVHQIYRSTYQKMLFCGFASELKLLLRQNWNVFLVVKLAFLCVHVSDDPDGFEYVTFSPLYQKYHGFITALDSCCCVVSQPDKSPALTGTCQCIDTCVMSWWLKG